MFEMLTNAVEQYLARKKSLAELREVRHALAGDILLAEPAQRDQAAFDFEGRLFALLVVLDNGDIGIDEFDAELREELRKARSLAA